MPFSQFHVGYPYFLASQCYRHAIGPAAKSQCILSPPICLKLVFWTVLQVSYASAMVRLLTITEFCSVGFPCGEMCVENTFW